MPINLDLDALRTFVLIGEGRSFTDTGIVVGRSQSAVSLQIQSLERTLNVDLFTRRGTRSVLAPDGTRLYPVARQLLGLNDEAVGSMSAARAKTICVGVSVDLGEAICPATFELFRSAFPEIEVNLTIGTTVELIRMLQRDKLDAVIGLERESPLKRDTLVETPMIWIGHDEFERRVDELLPLALRGLQCPFRAAALEALCWRYPYRIASSSIDPAGALASAHAGLAITVNTRFGLSRRLRDVGPVLDLPELPQVRYACYSAGRGNHHIYDELFALMWDRLRLEMDTAAPVPSPGTRGPIANEVVF